MQTAFPATAEYTEKERQLQVHMCRELQLKPFETMYEVSCTFVLVH
jgi:hypothetical protein